MIFRSPLAALAALFLLIPADAPAHGAYHELAAQLTERLQSDPKDDRARLRLAKAHLEHEEWELCLAVLDSLATPGTGIPPTAPARGAALLGLGRFTEAVAVLDAYLKTPESERTPTDVASALTVRARCRTAVGNHAAAADDFAAALSAHTGSPALHVEYADALLSAGRKLQALAALNRAMGVHRSHPEIMERAWALQAEMGRWDEARKTADALAATAPAPEPWMARHARVLMRSGKTEEANKSWGALRDHLLGLPSLQRGTPQNLALLAESGVALSQSAPAPVVAAPR